MAVRDDLRLFAQRWLFAGQALAAIQDDELRKSDPRIDLIALAPLFDQAVKERTKEERSTEIPGMVEWQATMRRWSEKLGAR
jgi:hypothetical protein